MVTGVALKGAAALLPFLSLDLLCVTVSCTHFSRRHRFTTILGHQGHLTGDQSLLSASQGKPESKQIIAVSVTVTCV